MASAGGSDPWGAMAAAGKGKGKGSKADGEGEKKKGGAPAAEADAADKKNKYRRDKPWDTEGIDHWKPVEASKDDVGRKGLLLEESSFATLFPQYREQYLKSVWPDVKRICAEHELKAELNLVEGSMTVKTTRKTWDPYCIIKGRDMLKLLARSVPLPQAQKILQDDMHCDIMKGQTVSVMGTIKGIKQVRRIIEDCFKNIHPIYHIKELMIRRELEKDPELKDENWERFLPKFKGVNVKRKKAKKATKKNKDKSPFPPEPTPRKEDELMASGQYFLNEQERAQKKRIEQRETMKATSAQRKEERAKLYVAPASASAPAKRKKPDAGAQGASTAEIAAKLKEKAATGKVKKARTGDALLL